MMNIEYKMGICFSSGDVSTYQQNEEHNMEMMTFIGDDDLHYCLQQAHREHRKPKFYVLFNNQPLDTVYEDEMEY